MAELKPASELRQERDAALAKPVLDKIAELIEGNKHRNDSILVDVPVGPTGIPTSWSEAFRKLDELGYAVKDQGYCQVSRSKLFSIGW